LATKPPAVCLWCFDLLHLNGVRITPLALAERKAQLAVLIAAAGDKHFQFSGDFSDPLALLQNVGK
jgi:ATP-dependent DNA ligase